MKTSVKVGIVAAIGGFALLGLAGPASADTDTDSLNPALGPNVEHTVEAVNYSVDAYNATLDATAETAYASKLYTN